MSLRDFGFGRRSMASYNDAEVIAAAVAGSMLAWHQLGLRLQRRTNKAPLEALCRRELGCLPDEVRFIVGDCGSGDGGRGHVRTMKPRAA